MTLTIDEFLSKKKPITETVTLVLDGEVVDQWNVASTKLYEAKATGKSSSVKQAQAVLDELKESMEAATIDFVFTAIGRKAYKDLVAQHPSTETGPSGQTLLFDMETFAPALIAASLSKPEFSEDDVIRLYESDNFNDEELSSLFVAALSVNNRNKVADLKKD